MRHFNKYPIILKKYFKNAINLGISGGCTQHVLWRLKFGLLPLNAKLIIVHVGTNNVGKNLQIEIAAAIVEIAIFLKQINNAWVVVMGLLPRGMYPSATREKISCVNDYLEILLHKRVAEALYVAPEKN